MLVVQQRQTSASRVGGTTSNAASSERSEEEEDVHLFNTMNIICAMIDEIAGDWRYGYMPLARQPP